MFTFFLDRLFHMLEDISSVPIFALIPANAIFMSISMYDVEVVRAHQAIENLSIYQFNNRRQFFFSVDVKLRAIRSTVRCVLFPLCFILAGISLSFRIACNG